MPYLHFDTDNIQVPEAFDWRSKSMYVGHFEKLTISSDAVTPTKDQGKIQLHFRCSFVGHFIK